MGKDREGKFHPRKGKPSASVNGDRAGVIPMNSAVYEEHQDILEKYTVGEEEPAPNIHVRHRNRNADKAEDRQSKRNGTASTRAKRQEPAEEETEKSTATEIQLLTKDKFTELAGFQSSCCVSAYLATHVGSSAVNEQVDDTVFKTLLQQIAAALKEKGINQDRIDRMLKPGYDLLRDDTFWKNMSPGLAVFIADGNFQYVKMPFTPKEELLINTSFFLSSLLPMALNRDYFYLLVLSKKKATLYRADAFRMVELIIDEMPNGVDDVVHFEEKDDQKLWRTGSSGAGAGANYHGTGAGKPDDKANLAMYFDEVDETIWKKVLNRENVPLLLAGVEYLIPIYRSVAQYKPIWNDALTGNFDYTDLTSLYGQALQKMQPYFRERHEKALEMYMNNSANGMTSSIPDDVIPAAHYKKVWHLFVQQGEHIWGRFDVMNNKLTVHETQQEGDECLIDKSVIHTLLNGGDVHVLPKAQMPGESKLAALMRYAS